MWTLWLMTCYRERHADTVVDDIVELRVIKNRQTKHLWAGSDSVQ